MLDLEPIKARVEAATEGPWEWYEPDPSVIVLGTKDLQAFEGFVLDCARCESCLASGGDCSLPGSEDRAFIARARTDIPELIAEVEELRDKFNALRSVLQCGSTEEIE